MTSKKYIIFLSARIWPDYVKERIRTTYLYFGGSLVFTAASAMMCFRSPVILRAVSGNSWMVCCNQLPCLFILVFEILCLQSILGTIAAMIATGTIVRSIPYKEGLGTKQAAWALHSAVIGAVVAPLCVLGGPLLLRAAV